MRGLLAYLALRVAETVLGAMPEAVVRRLGEAAGRAWWAVDRRRRRMAVRHCRRLGLAPTAAREMFSSYGRYWAESVWVRPRHFPGIYRRIETEGLDNLIGALAAGRGAVVFLPHLGNWEVAGLVARHIGVTVVAVAEALGNRRITEWFTRQRGAFGIEIVLTDSSDVAATLRRALNEEKVVALLADRDLSGRGVGVRFFGEETTLPAGPVSLALRTGAPLIPVGTYFREGGGHRVVVREPLALSGDVAEGVAGMGAVLEELIREAPTQWHLFQPNWPSDRR